ncbi:hypothetical protein C1645_731249 [Glomus cerebriforme]|uniref:Uncharacterized protein n=1 Tax=Glomus cerebriforme TaxID=658196 RepID=A0A397TM47_9GLOM|nr:hypothetical protein C1645_731249 [Glomus cerebriforme]
MASQQGPNPLDKLAAYFKPCTRQFSHEEYNNMDDTLTELREQQQKNPLDKLDVFFQPLTKSFDEADYNVWSSHNPFAEKIEIGSSVGISKIKSPRSNKFSTKTSTKRRKVDSFDDENKSLPLLSTTTTSSDASSSESSDDEEGDSDTFSSSKYDQQGDDDTDSISTQPKVATTSRKIAKPRSKKQVAASDESPKRLSTEKRNEKSQSEVSHLENNEGKEKEYEVLRNISKKIGGKCDQKTPNKNGTSKVHIAGFTGSRTHKYLDMIDNQVFKRHQKVITKSVREANLSSGLSSLLSGGFKPTIMLNNYSN